MREIFQPSRETTKPSTGCVLLFFSSTKHTNVLSDKVVLFKVHFVFFAPARPLFWGFSPLFSIFLFTLVSGEQFLSYFILHCVTGVLSQRILV
jgi:hypothetical protein